ncbi:MAG: TCR/Tet family MFS transporter [Caldilineaceae bacterium]|nr:TCR/Tet family MFS transporter [Caldilineaceae bacterium]MCB0095366.1 TCR/Tet family MFS transporter [Caldilineaceae bacterium]
MPKREAKLGFIFVTLLLDILGLGLIIPVLPKLIESFTNNNVESASTVYGIMIAVYALMQFIFAPILGSLSDQYGRRPVILISLLGSGLDYLLLAFAPSLSWLFVGRVISGVTAANITTASAYIVDVSAPEDRAKNFGILGVAFGLGFIIGPAIGGLLGDVKLHLPFLVVAGITLLNWLYGYFVLPESLKPENRRPFSWRRANPIGSLSGLGRYPIVLALVSTIVLASMAQNALQSTWVLYTDFRYNWGPRDVGLSLAVVGLSAAIVQGGLIGKIVGFLGERKALLVGLSISVVSFILYGLASAGWMLYVIPFLGALGSISGPSAQSIITQNVADNEQGAIQGALTSLNSLTGVIAPLIATNVFRYFISDAAPVTIPGAAFFIGAFFLVIALALAARTFRRLPETVAENVSEMPPMLPH